MGKLNIVVLYDRWEDPDDTGTAVSDRAPLTRSLDKKEVAAGYVLTCQAHPVTERVVLSYDER